MGSILSKSHSCLKPDNEIKVNNFRGIKYIEDEPLFFNSKYDEIVNVTGLLVIIGLCQEYFFDGMTTQKFFEIINYPKKTKWVARYKREVLVCQYCGGSGKRDWVSNAMNTEAPFDPMNRPGYKRIKNVYQYCKKFKYYLSKALLKTSVEEHCKNCCGTGLHFVKPENVMYIKKCEIGIPIDGGIK